MSDLRLDDALALLAAQSTPASSLPDPQCSPTAYLQALIDGLCALSQHDPLTGLANRRHFEAVLAREIEVVARSGEPALLLMLDIDHFKRVNDEHGHPVGDQVLKAVAQVLARCVRPMDTVARFGGEEFIIILPSCQGHFGQQVAERIRSAVATTPVDIGAGRTLSVTLSIGGAYAPRWVRSTPELWVDRADIELYRAKSEGRNRVCLEPQLDIGVSAEEKNLLFGPLSLAEPAWIESLVTDSGVGSADALHPPMN